MSNGQLRLFFRPEPKTRAAMFGGITTAATPRPT